MPNFHLPSTGGQGGAEVPVPYWCYQLPPRHPPLAACNDKRSVPNGTDLSGFSDFSALIGIIQTLRSRAFNFARPDIDFGIFENFSAAAAGTS